MTRSFKVLSEAQAAIQKRGPDQSGSLLGYEDGNTVIVLSITAAGGDQGKNIFTVFKHAGKSFLIQISYNPNPPTVSLIAFKSETHI